MIAEILDGRTGEVNIGIDDLSWAPRGQSKSLNYFDMAAV
jgi:hypothetical protein